MWAQLPNSEGVAWMWKNPSLRMAGALGSHERKQVPQQGQPEAVSYQATGVSSNNFQKSIFNKSFLFIFWGYDNLEKQVVWKVAQFMQQVLYLTQKSAVTVPLPPLPCLTDQPCHLLPALHWQTTHFPMFLAWSDSVVPTHMLQKTNQSIASLNSIRGVILPLAPIFVNDKLVFMKRLWYNLSIQWFMVPLGCSWN